MTDTAAVSRWNFSAPLAERRLEIMRSLAAIIREKDISLLTMQDVANRLGMTKGNLYHYFRSKQDLLYECHMMGMAESMVLLDNVRSGGANPRERLKTLIEGLVRSVILDPYGAVMVTTLDLLSPEQRGKYLKQRDLFEGGLRALIEAGVAQGAFKVVDVKVAGFAILGAVNWISRWYSPSGARSADEIGRMFSDLLVGGLCAPDQPAGLVDRESPG